MHVCVLDDVERKDPISLCCSKQWSGVSKANGVRVLGRPLCCRLCKSAVLNANSTHLQQGMHVHPYTVYVCIISCASEVDEGLCV